MRRCILVLSLLVIPLLFIANERSAVQARTGLPLANPAYPNIVRGNVSDRNTGLLLPDAMVTLEHCQNSSNILRSCGPAQVGTFSPAVNPMPTNATGYYQWNITFDPSSPYWGIYVTKSGYQPWNGSGLLFVPPTTIYNVKMYPAQASAILPIAIIGSATVTLIASATRQRKSTR